MTKFLFTILLSFWGIAGIFAQCTSLLTGGATTTCNTPIDFQGSAYSNASSFNFNGSTFPPGWIASAFIIGQPCGLPAADGTDYFWASAVAGQRSLTTSVVDMSAGGLISFQIRFGDDDPDPGCEQVDAGEGVYLQYSTDGVTYTNIMYIDPTDASGGAVGYGWVSFNVNTLPAGALTATTRFRWLQTTNSGANYDNWGLDNITISRVIPIVNHTWDMGDGTVIPSGAASQSHTYAAGGTYTVTYTAEMQDGCITTTTLNVNISEPLVLNCPANQTFAANTGVCGYTATAALNPVLSGNCSAITPTYTLSGATTGTGTSLAGVIFNGGITTVTWNAAVGGSSATCAYDVAVTETVPPVFTCNNSANLTLPIGECQTRYCYPFPSAIDTCGGAYRAEIAGYTYLGTIGTHSYYVSNANVDYNTARANCAAAGGYMVQISDAAENTQIRNWVSAVVSPATSYFIGYNDLEVEGTFVWEDCAPPTFTNWNAGEPNNSGNEDATQVLSNGTWNDISTTNSNRHILELNGARIVRTGGFAANTLLGVGSHTVSFEATDNFGNTTPCSFTVTVTDTQSPTITAPANVTVNTDLNACTASGVALGTATASDNCTFTITNNAPATFPLGNTTVTWTVTDANGLTATATQIVTVVDNQNPTITAPAALNITTDAGLCTASSVALGTPTAADNCTFTVTNNAPAAFPLGTTTVTHTVTDAAGNTATATQTVTVSFAGSLAYSDTVFVESNPTSGLMNDTIFITAPCPIFAGANGDDFVANGWVSVSNVPTGLVAEMVRIDDYTLGFVLADTANPHTPAQNVADLTVVFDDNAFLYNSTAANIIGSNRNDLAVRFKARPIPPLPPCPKVENLTATPLSSSSILLNWELPVGVEYVEVYLNGTVIANLPVPQNSFLLENLSHSTLHHFEVRTICNAAFSNMMVVYASIDATTLPTGVSLESVREVCGSGRVVLSVSGKTDWQGVYRWYENETDTTPFYESASGTFETPILSESKTYFVSIFELGQEGEKIPVVALVNEAYEARILNTLNADNELISCENVVTLQGEETAGARYAWKLNGFTLGGENTTTLRANVSGWYEFVVIRGNCTAESTPIRVRLKSAPVAFIQTQSNSLRFCSETVLSAAPQATPDAEVSYEWSFNGTILGTSAAITASQTGVYTLKVTDNILGCVAISQRRIEILNFPASIDLTASKNAICEGETAILSVPQIEGARYYWFLNHERLPLSGSSVEVNAGGTYKVAVFTPHAPCSSESAEFELTYYAAPKIRIRPNGNVLEVELSENVPFVWQVLDRNLGTNGQFVNVAGSENQLAFTPAQNGSYRVLATYGQNCETSSRSRTFAAITLGQEDEVPQNQGFSLFPNPTQNQVTLRFESEQKDLQIRLYDALGRELLQQNWTNAKEVSLDLSSLAQAVYTLQIVSAEMQQSIKIVKE
ncbi:HYR domain-containing protein [Hugenholtzia roseola]|uniref:HYR domain-containing protein n=1 Tax=Hugenholtzia roseola TaxID=1002 RepID=UPI000403C5BD|nr:HYR domain-containing protein [Hugenholtzia roseola]